MSEIRMTESVRGWFDVRLYNERLPKEQWKIKGDDDQISFATTVPAGEPLAQMALADGGGKTYTDNNGNERVRVVFKIGSRTRWFDRTGQEIPRPGNADIDGRKFECRIQYAVVRPDPNNQKSPRGWWVRAIQYNEVVDNPFEAMSPLGQATVVPHVQPEPQTGMQQPPVEHGIDGVIENLPF